VGVVCSCLRWSGILLTVSQEVEQRKRGCGPDPACEQIVSVTMPSFLAIIREEVVMRDYGRAVFHVFCMLVLMIVFVHILSLVLPSPVGR
jgi:hypothetical protein